MKLCFDKIKISVLILFLIFLFWPLKTSAAALSTLSDVMTRQKEGTTSSHDILFNLNGATTLDAGETVEIDFHEDAPESYFTVAGAATVVGDLDFNDGTERTILNVGGACAGGANNMIAAVDDAAGKLTFTACSGFTSSGLGATINVEYGTAAAGPGTNRVTNNAAHGTYLIDITAAGDTGKIATVIVDNEQVSLTGSVDPSITFSLSANASAFGTLSVGSITTSTPNITLTVGTNGLYGYAITVQDVGNTVDHPGFYNVGATYLIGSANATWDDNDLLEIGQEGYGIQASSAGATIAARYNQSGNNVGGFEITATPIASYATKMTANHTITIVHKAAIAAFTSAGSYADTVTYIATGNF